MRRNSSIKLKAAFLFSIFSLNMLVGFACAAGVNLGYNSGHHKEEATEIHIHADGSKHHHKKKTESHSHEKAKKDNCCNDETMKFAQSDKVMAPFVKIANPVFFTAFTLVYYNLELTCFSQVNISKKYFLRGYHPPIPDIRVAIQSFQI